jgi:multisubunit Na+/H+ antiporter MnhG subunit
MVVTALKAAGIGGSILVILALVIYLLKTLITFIGFLTGAIKILIVLVFIFLIVGVGLMVLRGLKERRRTKE